MFFKHPGRFCNCKCRLFTLVLMCLKRTQIALVLVREAHILEPSKEIFPKPVILLHELLYGLLISSFFIFQVEVDYWFGFKRSRLIVMVGFSC